MKRISYLLLILCLGTWLACGDGFAVTVIPGQTITTSSRWTLANSPYQITGNVYVRSASNPVLTIDPGVEVQFTGYILQIGGTGTTNQGGLMAVGTNGSHIKFTSAQVSKAPGDWQGIYFHEYAIDSLCNLTYCDIEYAGDIYNSNIYCNEASPKIINCTIQYSDSYGVRGSSNAVPSISSTAFNGNQDYPIGLYGNAIKDIFACTFSNNTHQGIEVYGDQIIDSGTWTNMGVPYVLDGGISIHKAAGTASLTLSPGVIIKSDGPYIQVGGGGANDIGVLIAKGTPSQRIYFTSLSDDSVGGDTNANGSATQPKAGDWDAVLCTQYCSASTILENCTLRYGGSVYQGIIQVTSSTPTFSNCSITNSSSRGIYGTGSTPLSILSCAFVGNTDYPVGLYGNVIKNVVACTFANNTHQGIEVYGDQISDSGTWTNMGVPYVLDGSITIHKAANTAALTLNPGVIIKFNPGIYMQVGGAGPNDLGVLYAKGTPSQRIYFTSLSDDSVGGDTNADGTATQPEPNDWDSFVCTQYCSFSTIFEYCTIRYGGNTYQGIAQVNGSNPTFSKCSIMNSSSKGIYGTGNASLSILSCAFVGNEDFPIAVEATDIPFLVGNTFANNTKQAIEVRGDHVYTSGTWNNQGVPFVVSGSIILYQTSSTPFITISPGNIVKFMHGTYFQVGGTGTTDRGGLIAKGTNGNWIYFTSEKDDSVGGDSLGDGSSSIPAPNDWDAIICFPYMNDSTAFDRCVFKYGGDVYQGTIQLSGASPSFTNCSILRSGSNGIYGVNYSFPIVNNVYFGNGDDYPLNIEPDAVRNVTGCVFAGNYRQGILVQGDTMRYSGTWTNMGIPYVLDGSVLVRNTTAYPVLTLNPGLVLKIDDGHYLEIGSSNVGEYGGLVAQGTASAPITFTSLHDDSTGGDTYGDGTATRPRPGDWNDIIFRNYITSSIMDNCIVRYGGNILGSIYVYHSSPILQHNLIQYSDNECINVISGAPNISHNTFAESSAYGVYVDGSVVPATFQYNTFSNISGGIGYNSTSIMTAQYNDISGSPAWGTKNWYSSKVQFAKQNWWGNMSGPYDNSTIGLYNPYGQGTKVSDYVEYRGWYHENVLHYSEIPDVKLLKGQTVSELIDLSKYSMDANSNWGWQGKGVDQALLNIKANKKVDYLATKTSNYLGVDTVIFTVNNYAFTTTKVKYSTYRINKLPKLGLSKGGSIQLIISTYTNDGVADSGRIAASYGSPSSLSVSDAGKLSATWQNTSTLQITATSSFTTGSAYVDVYASPTTLPPYGKDYDKERIWVYANLLANSTFSTANDTTSFAFQLPSDKPALPNIYYVASRSDNGGTVANGVVAFNFTATNQGTKITPSLSLHPTLKASKWYTARMRIFSPDVSNTHQAQIWCYNGIIPGNAHIDVASNILFGVPTVWTWIEAPMYANETGPGYPQIYMKAGSGTGTVYLDEVQYTEAPPTLIDAGRGNTRLFYPYGTFNSQGNLAMGWSTTESYSGAPSLPGMLVSDERLYFNFTGATGAAQKGAKLTARNNASGVYTASNKSNKEVGLRAYVNKYSGSFNTYNCIVYLACYGVPSNGQVNFTAPPGQMFASGEFGRITNGWHYIVGNGRNPYHQFQFAVKSDQAGYLEMDDVDFLREDDDPYFGDGILFP